MPKIQTPQEQPERLDYLDALRGIAILMVLSIHIIGETVILPFGLSNLSSLGRYGVTLFFIVSAYALFRSWELRKKETNATIKYFIRRFFRIAPAYYLIIFAVFLLVGKTVPAYSTETNITFANFITHILFINGLSDNYFNSILGVEWTIFTEVTFYLILPLILFFVGKFGWSTKFLTILFVLSLGLSYNFFISTAAYIPDFYLLILLFSPFFQIPAFVLGLLIYDLINKNKFFKSINWRIEYFIIYIVFMILYAYVIRWWISNLFTTNISLYYFIHYYYTQLEYLVMGILLAPLVIFLAKSTNWLTKVFNNKITIFFGKISYSLYLVHFLIILYLLPNLHIESYKIWELPVLSWVIALLISVIIAYLLYRFVEQPGIKLGKTIISKFKEK